MHRKILGSYYLFLVNQAVLPGVYGLLLKIDSFITLSAIPSVAVESLESGVLSSHTNMLGFFNLKTFFHTQSKEEARQKVIKNFGNNFNSDVPSAKSLDINIQHNNNTKADKIRIKRIFGIFFKYLSNSSSVIFQCSGVTKSVGNVFQILFFCQSKNPSMLMAAKGNNTKARTKKSLNMMLKSNTINNNTPKNAAPSKRTWMSASPR